MFYVIFYENGEYLTCYFNSYSDCLDYAESYNDCDFTIEEYSIEEDYFDNI